MSFFCVPEQQNPLFICLLEVYTVIIPEFLGLSIYINPFPVSLILYLIMRNIWCCVATEMLYKKSWFDNYCKIGAEASSISTGKIWRFPLHNFWCRTSYYLTDMSSYIYIFIFFFVENTKYFLTHTWRKGRRFFKETYSGVYPKGPNSWIHDTSYKPL